MAAKDAQSPGIRPEAKSSCQRHARSERLPKITKTAARTKQGSAAVRCPSSAREPNDQAIQLIKPITTHARNKPAPQECAGAFGNPDKSGAKQTPIRREGSPTALKHTRCGPPRT